MMRVLAAVMIFVLGLSPGALAAGEPESVRAAGPLHDAVAREAIRLARQNPASAATHGSERSWAGRHPVALGMLIGLAGGLAVGATQEYEGTWPFGPYLALGGGIGVGAGVGAIMSAVR